MKIIFSLTMAFCLLASCHIRRFYSKMEGRPNKNEYQLDSLFLDNSYQLYVRQIGKPKKDYAIDRHNMEEITRNDKERIELQYLLISAKNKRVIYLTTIPPLHTGDNDHRWIYDEPLFENTNYVNIWVLNLFFIGNYDPAKQTFTFAKKGLKVSDTWNFELNGDGTALTVMNMTDPDRSQLQHTTNADPGSVLSLPIRFYRQKDFHLGYDGIWSDRNFLLGTVLTGERSAIFYSTKDGESDVFFHVGTDPNKKSGYKDLWVHFYNIRVRYEP